MRQPRFLITGMAESGWLSPLRRRLIIAVLLILCAVLTLFPERYRVSETIIPTDPTQLGLGSALGQLGAVNGFLGGQMALEVSLDVARGQSTRHEVAERLHLVKRLGLKNIRQADRWLSNEVDIRALRGGLLEISMKNKDSAFALQVVDTYTQVLRGQLGGINRNQTAYKRKVLAKLVSDSRDRLDRAQTAYDAFRRQTRYSEPSASIAAIGARIPQLQAQIEAKQVELATQRQFNTDNSMAVRQILAEITALKDQLAQAESLDPQQSTSVGRVVAQSTEAQALEREFLVARNLFYDYRRLLQGTDVERLTANATVRVLEPATVDDARQINFIPLMLGLFILCAGVAIEFYYLRPPVTHAQRAEIKA